MIFDWVSRQSYAQLKSGDYLVVCSVSDSEWRMEVRKLSEDKALLRTVTGVENSHDEAKKAADLLVGKILETLA